MEGPVNRLWPPADTNSAPRNGPWSGACEWTCADNLPRCGKSVQFDRVSRRFSARLAPSAVVALHIRAPRKHLRRNPVGVLCERCSRHASSGSARAPVTPAHMRTLSTRLAQREMPSALLRTMAQEALAVVSKPGDLIECPLSAVRVQPRPSASRRDAQRHRGPPSPSASRWITPPRADGAARAKEVALIHRAVAQTVRQHAATGMRRSNPPRANPGLTGM